MLIRFTVSNFLSFNEEVEFNMLAGSLKSHKHHVYDLGKINVLKAAEIYGANGAGKSNLIIAIDFLQTLVKEGSIQRSIESNKFKLDKKNTLKPSVFEIEFYVDKKIYSYGVSIHQSSIVEEWLYESGVTREDRMVFERKVSKNGKPSIKMADKYQKSPKAKLLIELMEDNFLKNNDAFLSQYENLKIKEITVVRDWMVSNLLIIYPGARYGQLIHMLSASDMFKSFANDLLDTFDTGVKKLEIESIEFEKYFGEAHHDLLSDEDIQELNDGNSLPFKLENGESILIVKEKNKILVNRVVSLHEDINGQSISFELEEESDGTQRLLDFIPAFDMILKSNIVIVIDEIDQSLHPALLKVLIHKIMADETTKGQIVFTTHESNLLDLEIFRSDEIWFAEKGKQGSTQLYSLNDFKPRNDLDIRKGYLKGRFGAIPFLANLKDLNWNDSDA